MTDHWSHMVFSITVLNFNNKIIMVSWNKSCLLCLDDEIERFNLEERYNQGRTIPGFTAARTDQDLGEEEEKGSPRQPRELNSMFDPVESLRNPDHHLFR